MKPQFQHEIITSFSMWLENHILRKGEAFSNQNDQKFFYQSDDRLDDSFISFACPHKQWVTDSSIVGANVIDSITVDGNTVNRNTSGVYFDFDNGRVLIPHDARYNGVNFISATSSSEVKGSYSVKDFNIYITDQTEEELLLETQFDTNSRFSQDLSEGIKPYDQVLPAIFISYESSNNDPFAFGGQDSTMTSIRCVIFAENSYQLDGVLSLLNDSNNLNLTNVGFNEHPLNEFGDLKEGHFDYNDLIDRYFDYRSMAIVNSVNVSKLNDRVAKKTHPGLFLGFADFELMSVRMPRSDHESPITNQAPKANPVPLAPFQLTIARNCSTHQYQFNFWHNNATPHSVNNYNLYRQSGSFSTGFNDWHLVKTIAVAGTSTGEYLSTTDIPTPSGVDYNYKVSAENSSAEVFGINPTFSGINFSGC